MAPGEAEYDFETVVVIKIDSNQKRIEQLRQELFILHIPTAENLKTGDKILTTDFHAISFCYTDFRGELDLLFFQLKKSCLHSRSDNACFDRFHQIGNGTLYGGKLVLQSFDMKLVIVLFEIGDCTIYDEVDRVVIQAVHPDCSCYGGLDHIPANGFLSTGMLQPTLLTGVVVVQLSGSACAGNSYHIASTLTAT